MSETIPPPVAPPPVAPPPGPPPREKTPWLQRLGPIGFLLLAIWKWVLPGFKLLKGAKFLVTGVSMLVSVWVYAGWYGLPFAVGLVLSIFVHEMGHVFFAWRQGVPVTAPLFIPGFGALILQKKWAQSAYGEALIGIGGPLFGTLAALVCWALYFITGDGLYLALAYTGFLLNLFNMAPVYPLDGGWITAAVSPFLLIIGYVLLIAAAVTGFIRNPLIYLLVIFAVPHVWSMLKRGHADPEGGVPTTAGQRWGMGMAYVGLAGFLAWGMGQAHFSDERLQKELKNSQQVAAKA